jgi:hypothetical protein
MRTKPTASVQGSITERWKALQAAAAVYALGTAIHTMDHLRRGPDSVTAEVKELGVIFTLAVALVVTLIFNRYRFAPLFAVLIGFSHGIGILSLHVLPHWSVVSDSFLTHGTSLVSWFAVAIEVGGAFAVGLAGFAMLQVPSRGRHFAWLIRLVAAITLLPKGTAVVAGGEWDVLRVLAGFIVVFGALVLASRLAPPEWIPPGRSAGGLRNELRAVNR